MRLSPPNSCPCPRSTESRFLPHPSSTPPTPLFLSPPSSPESVPAPPARVSSLARAHFQGQSPSPPRPTPWLFQNPPRSGTLRSSLPKTADSAGSRSPLSRKPSSPPPSSPPPPPRVPIFPTPAHPCRLSLPRSRSTAPPPLDPFAPPRRLRSPPSRVHPAIARDFSATETSPGAIARRRPRDSSARARAPRAGSRSLRARFRTRLSARRVRTRKSIATLPPPPCDARGVRRRRGGARRRLDTPNPWRADDAPGARRGLATARWARRDGSSCGKFQIFARATTRG